MVIQINTQRYSYNCASLINIGIRSGVGDTSGLPRQPIRPTGELAGRRGDELVIGINDRILIQNNTKQYKAYEANRLLTARTRAAAHLRVSRLWRSHATLLRLRSFIPCGEKLPFEYGQISMFVYATLQK